MSIMSLEDNIPSHTLQPFVSPRPLDRAQRHALRRPPLSTRCNVQLAPSPQGPCHIRTIADGVQALDTFLSSTAPNTTSKFEPRSPPIKRRSSAQAPTRIKRGTHSRTLLPPLTEMGGTGNIIHQASIPCSPNATTAQRPPPHCHGGVRPRLGLYPLTMTIHLIGAAHLYMENPWQMHDWSSQSY